MRLYERIIYFLLLILYWSICDSKAQNMQNLLERHKAFGELYKQKKISKDIYLDSVQQWLSSAEISMTFFTTDSLENLLSLYKEISLSEPRLYERHLKYFVFLANNQSRQGHDGLAIYYLDQFDKANKALLNKKTVMVPTLKSRIYGSMENYDKVLSNYKKLLPYFKNYPDLIRTNSISKDAAINSVILFDVVSDAMINVNDSQGLDSLIVIATDIQKSYLKTVDSASMHAFVMNFNVQRLSFRNQFYLKTNIEKSRALLNAQREILYSDTSQLAKRRNWAETDYLSDYIVFYLRTNIDSAKYFIQLLRQSPLAGMVQYQIATLEMKYFEATKEYDSAYNRSQKLINYLKVSRNEIANDRDDLLNAFIESDENRKRLEIAKNAERKYNLYIGVSIALIVTIILASFYFFGRKSREMKNQIKQLNQEVEKQVITTENIAIETRQNEQKKIGMELHDSLAARLAAMLFSIENRKTETVVDEEIKWLNQFSQNIKNLYEDARLLSHRWVGESNVGVEESFAISVEKIVEQALPNAYYRTEVLVDHQALKKTTIAIRVELLYIIRESIVNILKHAKASVVTISIFKDEGNLYTVIKDNGKGFSTHLSSANQGIGIKNIRERVESLRGTLEIVNDSGTELKISLPIVATNT